MTDLSIHTCGYARAPTSRRFVLPAGFRLPAALGLYGLAAWLITQFGPLSFYPLIPVFLAHRLSLGLMEDAIEGSGNALDQAYGILFYIGSVICRIGAFFLAIPWILAFAALGNSGNLYELAMLIVLPAVYIGYPAVVVRNWKASGPI